MPSGVFSLKQVNQALVAGAWSNQKPVSVDYLVVAGGGGGALNRGGAGGGGGLLQGNIAVTPNTSFTVTIGAGGASKSVNGQGNSGNNSVFGSITATGGGGGGDNTGSIGSSGGSGGGSGNNGTDFGGQAVFNQGNIGGGGLYAGPEYGGGGGGGAGNRGSTGTGSFGGTGGQGIASDISGVRTAYAGGGGGSAYTTNSLAGKGGAGGGGDGSAAGPGINGTANTGGGGGGTNGGPSSAGGSGIVIISYPDIYQAAASTTGSPTVSTSGSGSLNFNGSNQYLAYSTQTALGLGTGDWTIEVWIYPETIPPADYLFVMDMRSGSNDAPIIAVQNGNINFQTETQGTIGSVAATINNWYHVAYVRNTNKLYTFVNGSLLNSGGTATTMNNGSSSPLVIGSRYTTIERYFDGPMTNFRLIKGVGLYTSNFTPPTAPLTPVSGTGILLNANSGAFLTDASLNSFRPTAASVTPTWSSSSPFATGLGYKNRVYTWTSSGSITF